ncbi:helix-turn-helix domain-containing protein [Ruminococcus sp. CLA-AA-H200]|uniref:Helix-turn-helix domain-containing protein n=2 Tax=Ruminococcus turbiniformis TaxID=2881258 RepID=A0ABS8FUE3_9FIRM|nr:helix-turn-helix domain-containing protein [Ruminococcus turbiniformis]
MTGPVEILQLRNSADHTDNAFIIYENNISGTSYASFSSAEEIKVLSTFNANSMSPLHSHEYYEFLFVIDGEIYQNIEHDRHYYPAGGCCLVSPYVLHTEEYDTDCRVLFFKISREFMQRLVSFPRYFSAENSPACSRLREYLGSERHYIDFIPANGYEWIQNHIHDLFEKMIMELSAPSDSASLKLAFFSSHLMMELFDDTKFSNTPAASGTAKEQELFYSIRDYMLSSDRKVTRSDLEAHFNYSGDNLYKIVRQYTGLSIHDYGSYICIKKAAELLMSSDRNINEIAGSVGFHNSTQFYKEFKKYCQMTPRQYRLRKSDRKELQKEPVPTPFT